MSATCGLHWWTVALSQTAEEIMDRIPGGWGTPERRGGFNQPLSVVHESGAKLFFGSAREDQPAVFSATGEVCESFAAELVDWSVDLGARVTRCDLACDVEPADRARARLIEMKRAFVRGKCFTSMKSDSFDERRSRRPDEGWTMYFGSSASSKFQRAYDRRGPLRLEWQWKPGKHVGQLVPEWIHKKGVVPMWRSLARSLVFPMSWYQELLEGDSVELAPEPDVRATWLKVLEELRKQWGAVIFACNTVGFDVRELGVAPEAPRRDVVSKFRAWADGAEAAGYDGEALRREIERCQLKSGRGRSSRPAR